METGKTLQIKNYQALESVLDVFLEQSRTRLDNVRNSLQNLSQEQSLLYQWAKKENAYPLMCGFSQELMVYNLQDNGFIGRPFTSDAIKESPFSHCAASMPVHLTDENKQIYIMLDPTYTQFALPDKLYPAFGLREIQSRNSPVLFLNKTEEGQKFWETIKEKGYFLITPDAAKIYVESLCPRISISAEDAARNLMTPPYHKTNLKHGKTRLSQQGCLGIDLNEIIHIIQEDRGDFRSNAPVSSKSPVFEPVI